MVQTFMIISTVLNGSIRLQRGHVLFHEVITLAVTEVSFATAGPQV